MTEEYSLTDMVNKIKDYYRTQDYEPQDYTPRLYNVRLPIDCIKWKSHDAGEKEIDEEIVIDIITESHISKDTYMPDKEFEGCMVLNASSVKFFQYYLPRAKIYWAYGYYINKDDEDFKRFKQACIHNGIGLLEVSDNDDINVELEAIPLYKILNSRLEEGIRAARGKKGSIIAASDIIAEHEDEYIRYLVYFGEPLFTRRAITEREDDSSRFLSMLLVNKLADVKKIAYAEDLRNFTSNYRYLKDSDHLIAFNLIADLWKKRFDIEYPDIQRDFEVVLRLSPYYRDHFLHQFQVFILGAIIIDALYDEDWVKEFEHISGSKIEDAWLACSAYHDYNYPVQQWDDWMTRFLTRNFHSDGPSGDRHINQEELKGQIVQLNLAEIAVRDEFMNKLKRLGEGLGCNIDDCFQRFFLRRIAIDKNHAILGAFTFLEKFQECKYLSSYAVNAAATSIMLHDDSNWLCFQGDQKALCECCRKDKLSIEEMEICKRKIFTHLSLDSMPLAFLLAFCDVAQEWGRQGRGYDIDEPRLDNLETNAHRIHVHISVSNHTSCKRKEEEVVRLGHFLKDTRFEIRVSSRDQLRDNTMKMSGN